MKSGIIICDRQEKASIKTVITVLDCLRGLKKEGQIKVIGGDNNLTTIRTQSFKLMKDEIKDNLMRGFLIDSDVIANFTSQELMEYVKYADDHNYNFSVPYAMGTGQVDIINSDTKAISTEEFKELRDWDVINSSGLGFYYGDIPLDYEFHSDNIGEDIHFFRDNFIDLRVVKSLKLTHYVSLPLRVM